MNSLIFLFCAVLCFAWLNGVKSSPLHNVSQSRLCFPPNFIFGVSTSAYQTEGAWNVSGKGESIWDRYSHEHPERVFDHKNGDVASGSYYNIKEDVKLMAQLGVQFYRFSVSWSRILPTGLINKVNEDGIRYYSELLDELARNRITPVVTMYHWDLPQSLQDLGGWTNPIMADYFADYARLLLDTFGGRIKMWQTFNQPEYFCHAGYGGDLAPGARSSGFQDYMCGHNVLRAHGKVYRMFDNEYRNKTGGQMGFAVSFSWMEPASTSDEDQAAAERIRQFFFGWFAHPLFSKTGDYPPIMRSVVDANSKRQGYPRSRLPSFTPQEVDMIRGSCDFLGLNHYTTYIIKHGSNANKDVASFEDDMNVQKLQRPEWPKTNSTWLTVVPWGFRKALNWVRVNYNNPMVMVTENGVSFEPGLHDPKRINYIDKYLRSLHQAIYEDGCSVMGYSYWSLVDNYDWTRGFSERFGLHAVDYASPKLTRTPRLSAKYYSNVVKTKCLPNKTEEYASNVE